ncbi:diguanylate cyclase [Oscillatoria sp. FACHB-1406]|uniref:diguanylate cyclase domain-containing protein n=1 Tax=Oscillatoria sp. FACHB-1406 TaxID=2692846 RepID=UPI001683B859|nr:diguanylate cyclase [Oscillatoria sp. FACHB-1406]MBD2576101.1 diguanylate cyclase [Oscillatoria sp. FACHB-1406]
MLTTVLLVEDNSADARLLELFLARTKGKQYSFVRVETLAAALKAVEENEFSAILLDLSLPDSHGLETLGHMYETAANVPIVVLTGFDDEELAIAALREGAQDYLIKNEIDSNVLRRAIHYAIERQQMLAQMQASEVRYRGIVEDLTEFICRFLPDGTITFANDAYCRYFGLEVGSAIGQRFLPPIPFEDAELVRQHFEAIAPQTPTHTIEHRVIVPNGEIRWQQRIDRAIFDERGRIVEYQSVGRDITALKQVEEQLQQRLARERLLGLITQRILQSSDPLAILQTTVDELSTFLECDRVIVGQFQPDGSSQVIVEALRFNALSMLDFTLPEFGIVDALRRVGTKEEIDPLCWQHEALSNELAQFRIQSQWVVPIWTSGRGDSDDCHLFLPTCEGGTAETSSRVCLWGLLAVHQSNRARQWDESETSLLEQVANQLAIAIQQFQLYQNLKAANQELKLLASVDGLTQAANRRCFDEYLDLQWERSLKEGLPLSLILCDIDFFKFYNDCYGHLAGDECLKQVVAQISSVVRNASGLVARYGGEEFAIVLPDTALTRAYQIAQQISARVKALQIPHARSEVNDYVTLSLGVASTIPRREGDSLQLIAAADRALYHAKASGRDRAVQKLMVVLD